MSLSLLLNNPVNVTSKNIRQVHSSNRITRHRRLPIPSHYNFIIRNSPFITPLLKRRILRNMLIRPRRNHTTRTQAGNTFRRVRSTLKLRIMRAQFLRYHSGLNITKRMHHHLIVNFRDLPRHLHILRLIRSRQNRRPIMILHNHLGRRSTSSMTLGRNMSLEFLTQELHILSGMRRMQSRHQILRTRCRRIRTLSTKDKKSIHITMTEIRHKLRHLNVHLRIIRGLSLITITMPTSRVLMKLRRIQDAQVRRLILNHSTAPLILSRGLRRHIRRRISRHTLSTPNGGLLLPVLPLLDHKLRSIFPTLLRHLLILTIRRMILRRLHHHRTRPRQISNIRCLLLILTLNGISTSRLSIQLSHIPISLLQISVLRRMIMNGSSNQKTLRKFTTHNTSSLFRVLPIMLTIPRNSVTNLRSRVSLGRVINTIFYARYLRRSSRNHRSLLTISSNTGLKSLKPNITKKNLLRSSKTRRVKPLQNHSRLRITRRALPLLFSPSMHPLMGECFRRTQSIRRTTCHYFSYVRPWDPVCPLQLLLTKSVLSVHYLALWYSQSLPSSPRGILRSSTRILIVGTTTLRTTAISNVSRHLPLLLQTIMSRYIRK